MHSPKLRVLLTLSLAAALFASAARAQAPRPRRPAGGADSEELIVRAQRLERGSATMDLALTLASGRNVEVSRKDVAKAARSAGGYP